jgi:cob(I)alamin adenosyltransferase
MKIYTRKGDKGSTQLIGGRRVFKNHIRIEAYGTVDELNSWIGLLCDILTTDTDKKQLRRIQEKLFVIASWLACEAEHSKMKLPALSQDDITGLETAIDRMNEHLPELRAFILPGGHQTVSFCHITRCVCRRAERNVVAMSRKIAVDPLIIAFLNRLSDYLFVLARFAGFKAGANEIKWQPERS